MMDTNKYIHSTHTCMQEVYVRPSLHRGVDIGVSFSTPGTVEDTELMLTLTMIAQGIHDHSYITPN